MTRGLILAAGRGRRMGACTDEHPKGLIQLNGRPLIDWQMTALREAGAAQIAIVRGYRGEALEFDATYFENTRWSETNMVASLVVAADWMRAETCLVSYADLVYPPRAALALASATADIAILYDVHWRALWQRRFSDPLCDAETLRIDRHGGLSEIGARPESLEEIEGQFMGLLRITPAGFESLLTRYMKLATARRDQLDVTALLDLAVKGGEFIQAVAYDDWWCELDSPRDLEVAAEIVGRSLR